MRTVMLIIVVIIANFIAFNDLTPDDACESGYSINEGVCLTYTTEGM